MLTREPTPDEDEEFAWFTSGLRHSYRLTSLLPAHFPAYVRLLHPIVANTEEGRTLTRWRQVAARSHSAFHPQVRFRALAMDAGMVDSPFVASLPREDAEALVSVLAGFTGSVNRCRFCLWDGYGLSAPNLRMGAGTPLPLLSTPRRNYLLWSGPLQDALDLMDQGWEKTPDLWWPSDHTWCVATDTDLDATYVGGSASLARALLGEDRLEALPADPDDSILLVPNGEGH